MSISKLLATTRGQILLINAYDLAQSGLLDPGKLHQAVVGLNRAARKLPNNYDDAQLIGVLQQVRNRFAPLFQASAKEHPSDDTRIAAVRTFDHVRAMLSEIQKVHQQDARIRRALAPKAPEAAVRMAADVLNEYVPRMPALALGIPYNLFWATTVDEIARLEQESAKCDEMPAELIRDRLGLCQIVPSDRGEPCHMFVFESTRPIGEIKREMDVAIARPTTIDGFDNPRFRQRKVPCPSALEGCGVTVDLGKGVFTEGVPEVVSTNIPLKSNFRCRWIGKVTREPAGSDAEFLEFVRAHRSLDEIEEVVRKLQ